MSAETVRREQCVEAGLVLDKTPHFGDAPVEREAEQVRPRHATWCAPRTATKSTTARPIRRCPHFDTLISQRSNGCIRSPMLLNPIVIASIMTGHRVVAGTCQTMSGTANSARPSSSSAGPEE